MRILPIGTLLLAALHSFPSQLLALAHLAAPPTAVLAYAATLTAIQSLNPTPKTVLHTCLRIRVLGHEPVNRQF